MVEGRGTVETRAQVSWMLAKGMSRRAIADALGLSKSTVSYHARRLGEPVDERGARRYDWGVVQRYKENSCENCGLTAWLGQPLSMALHHVNGDGRDNRLENLQFLCPNCHSQTDNFSGKGRRRLEVA
jgi:Homeodomain-like domain/HNH endonuclease